MHTTVTLHGMNQNQYGSFIHYRWPYIAVMFKFKMEIYMTNRMTDIQTKGSTIYTDTYRLIYEKAYNQIT